MSYSFQHEESINANIRRVYTELLDECIHRLTNSYGKSHSAVHETRKCFKKMRALFRLVRYEVGEDTYQAYNIFFREEGRKISALRDVNVLIDTLDDLKNNYQETLSDDVFSGIRANLLRKKHALSKKLLYREKVLQKIFARLEEAEVYLSPLHIQKDDFSAFREGLCRVYKKGSKGLATVYAKRTVRNFHDWRKRMKYLRYQTDLLSPAWPSVMSLLEKELHHLTDILGDHHDLSVLENEILKLNIKNQEVLDILLGLIHQRKTALEEEALLLGAKLFAEKPKSFVKRLETYWSVWKSNTHKESAQEVAIVS